MWQDSIVEEIPKIREELAVKFQYDVQALGKFFQTPQATEHHVVVTRAPRRVPEAAQGPTSPSVEQPGTSVTV